VPLWAVSAAFWLIVVAVAAARAAGVAESQVLGTFGVVFVSIVVEALPFILLGAVASALIAVFVPAGAFARIGRLPHPVQVPAAAAAGFRCRCASAARCRWPAG
jgi:uncharacterized protein